MHASNWHAEFLSRYPETPGQRSLLLAPPGSGKTALCSRAIRTMLNRKLTDVAIILMGYNLLHEQWYAATQTAGINVMSTVESYQGTDAEALCVSSSALGLRAARDYVCRLARARRLFVVMDEISQPDTLISSLIDDVLAANESNRALFLSMTPPDFGEFDAEFSVDARLQLKWSITALSTPAGLAKPASALRVLRQLARDISNIDTMSWRHFEQLVATLLEGDGYEVKLMQGSRDGGVDVVAIKGLGECGQIKVVVQVKRWNRKHKVDVTVIRQLSDVRSQHCATKGLIVTSSYLTGGALARVERDKSLLAKVDRDDLSAWIQRAAHRQG